MKKACVIGSPIAHSRSPLIHNYWLKFYGLKGFYEKREVLSADLGSFLGNLKAEGYVGCNVTIPHKEAALAFIPAVDDVVKKTGALNTVYFEGEVCRAMSTDGEGFYQNLQATLPGFNVANQAVAVLGAGGSARSVVERLLRVGVAEVKIFNRTLPRAEELRHRFGSTVTVHHPDRFGDESKNIALLVNTTSQGMKGQPRLAIDLSALPSDAVVADLVYVPLKTELLQSAQARNLRIVGGLGMLLHQAVGGFEKWFGRRPEVTQTLFNLVARDVDPDFQP